MAPVSALSESAASFEPSGKSIMKVSAHLIVAAWAAMSCCSWAEGSGDKRNSSSTAGESELSRAAAAQLQRLASFPRSGLLETSGAEPAPATKQDSRRTRASASKRPSLTSSADGEDLQLRIPIDFSELFRIFSDASSASQGSQEASQPAARDKRKSSGLQLTPDRMKALDRYADKIMQDESVQSYMRERIKRDGAYGGFGAAAAGGKTLDSSGAFISGLAGQLVGSVIGLASSASRTSSSSSSSGHSPGPVYGPPQPVYGPPAHSYGKESLSVWDIKKAILNTLIQAVKAIGGGVLALKGQIIKGSGFLVSTKGRIISSAGDSISSLGKSLASSAVVQAPPAPPQHSYPSYGHVGYGYESPGTHVIGHDSQYAGPPPNPDAYHSAYATASDDANLQAGLLIAKPTTTSEDHTEHTIDTSHVQSHHFQPEDIPPENIQTEYQQNDYSPATDNVKFPKLNSDDLKGLVGHVKGTLNFYQPQDGKAPETQAVDEIPSIPGNSLQLQEHNQENYELYPPLGNGPSDDEKLPQQPPRYEAPVDFKNPIDNAQKYEYPPESFSNTYTPSTNYGIPNANLYKYLPSKLHYENPNSADIQLEISNQDITGFETGGFARHRKNPGLHIVTMQEPLKIPILGPNTLRHYKRAVFPPIGVNPLMGISAYSRYGPAFQIQQSVGYKLRNRRDGSFSNIYRI